MNIRMLDNFVFNCKDFYLLTFLADESKFIFSLFTSYCREVEGDFRQCLGLLIAAERSVRLFTRFVLPDGTFSIIIFLYL